MITLEKLKSKITTKSRFQDVIFIIGILAFTTVLVLGLFPKTEKEESAARVSFIYLMMIIPIIVAIYFIIISFKRKLYSKSSEISSSITFKIALAFVFVAILSSLPIILITNNIINHTFTELISENTINALEESVKMSHDSIRDYHDNIQGELKTLDYSIGKGTFNIRIAKDRKYISNMHNIKGLNTIFYKVHRTDFSNNNIANFDKNNSDDNFTITKFLRNTTLKSGYCVSNISIDERSIIIGKLLIKGFLIIIYKELPGDIFARIYLYKDSLARYESKDFLKPYFHMGVGIVLLIMAIFIIVLSISLGFFLSRNITRPVLELANAAGDVASGNFNINLNRASSDELTLLFNSFNQMVKQLNESRKMVYQAQKLEAWREVARKLIHEIKNPLTPIRLSAERIQKRLKENKDDVENVILTGTDTIIEEVKVLTSMLSEFTRFARLPEMKGEFQNINPIIENCVNSFLGHEQIKFHLVLDNSIPDIFVDKILFRQALINMLQNSVDAIENTGNIHVKSELIYIDEKKIARLSIRDDGIGILEKYHGKIFDPTFSTKESGTGIGLAIVNKIILEHNGKIVCNSVYRKGTEFIIDIPITEEEVNTVGKNTSG